LGAGPARADQGSSDEWQASITPYIWAPTIHGELNFTVPTGGGLMAPGPPVGITIVPSQYTPKLDSAFMFTAETHTRTWGLGTDIIYMNLGVANASVTDLHGPLGHINIPINTNMTMRFASTLWTLDGTYSLANTPRWSMDALAGGRYIYAPIRLTWNFAGPLGILAAQGTHFESASIWDAIIGVKGKVALGDGHWYVPYYVDVGTGEAPTTWQGIGGVGYSFKNNNSILLVYRNLYYNQGGSKLLHELNLGGPALGYRFHL
jgi:hypothetical protein